MRYIMISIAILIVANIAQCQSDCDKYPNKYRPKNLNDAIEYLDCTWSEENKESYRLKPEGAAVTDLHFTIGASIRSYWGLFDNESELYKYFDSIGITNPEDISSVILTSFHRHLNKKDIRLSEQADYYKDIYRKYYEEEKKWKDKISKTIESINVGDTVAMNFSRSYEKDIPRLDFVMNYRFPVAKRHICTVVGVVREINATDNHSTFMEIEVIDLCSYYFDNYYQEIQLGENQKIAIGKNITYDVSVYNIKKLHN